MSQFLPIKVIVTVSGGAGQTLFGTNGGQCLGMTVKVPSDIPTYDVELWDLESFPHFGAIGASGTSYFPANLQLWDKQTIYIANATADGIYQVKLWVKPY